MTLVLSGNFERSGGPFLYVFPLSRISFKFLRPSKASSAKSSITQFSNFTSSKFFASSNAFEVIFPTLVYSTSRTRRCEAVEKSSDKISFTLLCIIFKFATSPKLVKIELGMWRKSERLMATAVIRSVSRSLPWKMLGFTLTLDVSWCSDDWLLKWQNVNPRRRSTNGVQSIGSFSHPTPLVTATMNMAKINLKKHINKFLD